jgi:hypothetical protein
MKFRFKEIIFTLVFAGLIMGFAFWQGKKECEGKLQQQLEEQKETTVFPEVKKPVLNSIELIPYFPAEEIKIINAAAKRNNLRKELYPVLYAIRRTENGRAGCEFGIIHPRAWNTNLDTQAGWAAATVQKNYDRWVKAGRPFTFITYLGMRYCPVGAENDPNNLNKNWIPNVAIWADKIKG